MILSDLDIKRALDSGEVVIRPFRAASLGSNSYDVHLGSTLAVYDAKMLDARVENTVQYLEIGPEGTVLQPGRLYLGVTEEYTETRDLVPFLEGKSSTGRLGISVHATAGKGDEGFANHWTLELSVIQPVRVYVGMPIAQLIYFRLASKVGTSYGDKPSAKYTGKSARPQPSAMWRNFSQQRAQIAGNSVNAP